MTNILFIKTSSLGDVIHHMSALTEARQHLADAHFSWVVEEAFAPLVALHPAVSEVIPVATRRWRSELLLPGSWGAARGFVHRLRAHHYDKIIDTQGLFRTGLMTRFARGEHHGYDAASVREKLAARFYDVQHHVERAQHAVARNRALTGLALGYSPDGAPDYGLDRARLAGVAPVPYAILLHATARPEKEWPEESWVALGRKLEHRFDLLLPWGSEAERVRAERLAAQLSRARVPIRRPIDEMARLIAGAAMVVGVDTGLLHLAAALGVPLVGIYGMTRPSLTGPVGSGPIAIADGENRSPPVADVVAAAERVMPAAAPVPAAT
jgi:heptosyltransferase-1